MRIALIATGDGTPASEGGLLAGRSLARHQLDFALALGCEKVILFGHGASEEAIALRHAAEAGGAQVQVVRGVRDLPAAVRGDDLLLVMAHGLLPDSSSAFEQLKEGTAVLILPAEAGWSAGFERLDLAAAWGGAMVLPGRLVAQLDQLPEDAEPIAGLLRIARQAGVPERPLAERELAEGRWQIVRGPDARLGKSDAPEDLAEDGGLEQQRHPGLHEQSAPQPETTPDPAAALADDEDIAADQRAMDQARGLTAVARGYALNEGSDHDLVPGL